ncbi:type IV pilus modification PilV family protein [Vibrio sp. LaRot3]|uniref:type IV pilus modification PilV family protein n=1 Tax=Vibrio sp. LaRot3 TaxID=2998829 RepID=UPI0022CE05D0|nr:type II secretion system protein [Vibrio sp. LaRot3]MDA0147875.1 type II secretion system protein [Vibrio sp. LaRot3]
MAANKASGFTLIENVMAITLAGFLMLAFTSLLAPAATQSADVLTQQRASQVATLILKEMYSREFDEANIQSLDRCETCSTNFGFNQDGDLVRDDFDDYDTGGNAISIQQFGIDMDGPYQNFLVQIDVAYVDSQFQPLTSGTSPTKQATLTITNGNAAQAITFVAYRSNY